ncbi:MAG: MBL fold metallo-hydrolase [Chloroflexi bacterium]|nr:MBL fold metallo-hydrolase [Chloroflexota bacterium]
MPDAAMLDDCRVLPISLGANWVYALPAAEPARDGILLVDAGPDYDGAWAALTAQLEAAGLAPADVRTVVVTHAHIDHCGLARRWQEMGAEVVGGAAEVERFALGDRVVRYQVDLIDGLLREAGFPDERREEALRRRRVAGRSKQDAARDRWPAVLRGTPFTPDRALEDGEVLTAGERQLRFVAAPGHTPGNAVCLEEASGSLFSGDQLLPRITPNPGIHFLRPDERFRGLPAYTKSLERIATLGAEHLYPGHGEPRQLPVGRAIRWTLARHTQRRERLLRCLRDGPLTPYELLLRFFRPRPGARLLPAFAEVQGHIDVLLERREVVEERAGGALRLRPAGATA